MRFKAVLCTLLVLSGCAATPAAHTPTVTSGPVQPGRAAALLRQAGGAEAPTPQDITRALGDADIVRQDGVGVAMTYRLETCALLLLFAADQRNAMRLREAHPSARRVGAPAPSLDQCGAEADARRS